MKYNQNTNKKNKDIYSTIHFKVAVSLALILISLLSSLGLNNTISAGERFFYMDDNTKLKYFYYLYLLMIGGQFAFGYILSLFSKGLFRDASTMITSGIITLTLVFSYQALKQDPLEYLDPKLHQNHKAKYNSNSKIFT